ncbi:MAG: UDP-3-O-(3-hydroxymyristoyl)glucosamine N-acyltransferase [Pseudomonadota bacterium]
MAGYTLAELALHLGCGLVGDGETRIVGVCTLFPGLPGRVSFLANPAYRRLLGRTEAAAVVLNEADSLSCPVPALIAANPHLAFARLAELFAPPRRTEQGIHPTAVVDQTARVHPSAQIGPHCIVGAGAEVAEAVVLGSHCVVAESARIGPHSQLVARVYIGPGVSLGSRCVLHPGVVIGADGFGFARDGERWVKVPQLGAVRIGDDVEIGANTTVDRGALDDTVLEDGVKLDNQIQIGHNVHIGAHTVIAACSGISGSTVIGRRCMIGGGVGMNGHLQIADDVVITGMTMVTHSLHAAGVYSSGLPVDDNRRWQRNVARFRHLDTLAGRVRHLERSQTAPMDPEAAEEGPDA